MMKIYNLMDVKDMDYKYYYQPILKTSFGDYCLYSFIVEFFIFSYTVMLSKKLHGSVLS